MKRLQINTSKAIFINDPPQSFTEYESINITAGSTIVSRKIYDKIMEIGVNIDSGKFNILDIKGKLAEIPSGTIITEKSSFDGSYLFCDGDLIIEDLKGLDGITGLFANRIFYPDGCETDMPDNITVNSRVIFTKGSGLHIGDMKLDEESFITLKADTLFWIHGDVSVYSETVLKNLLYNNITFYCHTLTIYEGLLEKYRNMFTAKKVYLVKDGHAVVNELTLEAGTLAAYGDKIYVKGNMKIADSSVKYLKDFSSIIVKGTVTMPVTHAEDFKEKGSAGFYDFYSGILIEVSGEKEINHEMLQNAINQGVIYTIRVNGKLIITDDVKPEDLEAIISLVCNGILVIKADLRNALEIQVKLTMNGTILYEDSDDDIDKNNDPKLTVVNTGSFKF